MKFPLIKKAMKQTRLEDIKGYDQVILTGGEPMLYPEETTRILQNLKCQNPNADFFIYTALASPELYDIMRHLDGLTFTLHKKVSHIDLRYFEIMQSWLLEYQLKSRRLAIIHGIQDYVNYLEIKPEAWDFIKLKRMMTEEELRLKSPTRNGLPPNEELLLLTF